ncbi:MAG TPA: Nif3-like dinuclear metal center hexameric protein [Chitinophagaceae bacterium]|nr:Nif3-like dinuclear metal center hexameric protein [Chitinophagaceae bacterium]
MKLATLIAALEAIAPASLQESYDNAGLLTGQPDWHCTGAIVSLDATEEVIDEAISQQCNLVIAHHPIIFKGLKKLNGKNYIERAVIKAIKNDIALYAIHTNLDNVLEGVNGMIAEQLGLLQTRVLAPRADALLKLVVFVPEAQAEAVRNALFAAGAGHIGNYSECSFNSDGTGTFTAGSGANPFIGAIGRQEAAAEIKIETIFPAWLKGQIIAAIRTAHPYEEPAFDMYPLANMHQRVGAGLVGSLPSHMAETAVLTRLKEIFRVPVLRHSPLTGRPVQVVALCGGAGSFLIPNAIAAKADLYITGDMKYHEFFDADSRILIADPGHYETEQFTTDLLIRLLREKFPTFAALKTGVRTNPVHYFL